MQIRIPCGVKSGSLYNHRMGGFLLYNIEAHRDTYRDTCTITCLRGKRVGKWGNTLCLCCWLHVWMLEKEDGNPQGHVLGPKERRRNATEVWNEKDDKENKEKRWLIKVQNGQMGWIAVTWNMWLWLSCGRANRGGSGVLKQQVCNTHQSI